MLSSFVLSLALTVIPQSLQGGPPDCALEVLTPEALEQRALADFDHGIEEYVRLHRRLARWLPPEQVFADEEDMGEAADLLADAILAARPNARPGSIFSPAATGVIRQIIARTEAEGPIVRSFIARPYDDLIVKLERPVVNDRYLWGPGAHVPAALLQALPPLPRELAYRVVQNDLVLVDVLPGLVVDVLEDAFVDSAGS